MGNGGCNIIGHSVVLIVAKELWGYGDFFI